MSHERQRPRWWVALTVLSTILLVALFFRTHNLTRVPPGLDGDEMFNAWDAARVGPGYFPVFFPANYGREPSYIYLIALFKQFLGMGAWTIRLPAAICGTLTVLLTYVMVRRLLSFRIGVLAAALMTVSLWPVLISRVGLRAVVLPLLQVFAIYAADRGVRDPSIPWAVVAGLSLGLLPYTYIPGQIFPAVVLLWLILVFLFRRPRPSGSPKRLAIAGGLALLVVLPFALFAVRNVEATYTRVGELNYELTQLLAGNWQPAWRSTRAVLRMLTWAGDPMWRYNPSLRPVFDWVTGGFFYLGLLVSRARMRRPGYLLLVVWLPLGAE
ncbi:MAG: glycosyltransferase family 39 protein [Anaerolineae bacterium]